MTLLEADWGPRRGQRKVFPEKRSSQKVEELKRAQSKSRTDTREQLQNKSCRPQANSKAKVVTRPKTRRAERSQPAVNSGLALRKPPQAVAPGMSQIPSMEKQFLVFICIKLFFPVLFRGGRKDLHNRTKETRGFRDASKNPKVLAIISLHLVTRSRISKL